MVDPKRQFELVQEEDPPEAGSTVPETSNAGLDILLLSLQALSKRTLVALSSLFCLLTVGSVFVLFYNTPSPSVLQIVSLSIYAVFVAAINIIVRRM
jgi:hypothetical protein